MPKPIIDEKKCTVCGECVEVCPVDILETKNKKTIVAKPDDCIGCRACEAACANKEAIKVED